MNVFKVLWYVIDKEEDEDKVMQAAGVTPRDSVIQDSDYVTKVITNAHDFTNPGTNSSNQSSFKHVSGLMIMSNINNELAQIIFWWQMEFIVKIEIQKYKMWNRTMNFQHSSRVKSWQVSSRTKKLQIKSPECQFYWYGGLCSAIGYFGQIYNQPSILIVG